jgi:hypothetical protein
MTMSVLPQAEGETGQQPRHAVWQCAGASQGGGGKHGPQADEGAGQHGQRKKPEGGGVGFFYANLLGALCHLGGDEGVYVQFGHVKRLNV